MDASVLGFGGAEIGYQRVAASTVARLLASAVDAGLNVIDTAECYDLSESLIGKALGDRRREVYLFTKCGHLDGWVRPDWRPDSIVRSVERSLGRLRTDHVDLIQLHSCSERELRTGDVIDALDRIREQGHARYIGYSGDGAAARYAVECGRFDTLQISVNIADQEAVDLVLPRARARRMGVIAKRPLANAAWTYARKPAEVYHQPYWIRLRKLAYPFLSEAPEVAAAAALRFTLSLAGVHTAIVGTTRPERWHQNAAAVAAGPLSRAQLKQIRDRWREVASASWTGQV
jgi:aryl-alcohol dehydrogenase-like predicted oxidoreductase